MGDILADDGARELLNRLLDDLEQLEKVDDSDQRDAIVKNQCELCDRLKDKLLSNNSQYSGQEAPVPKALRKCVETAKANGVEVPSAAWNAFALPLLKEACLKEWEDPSSTSSIDSLYGIRGSIRKWTKTEQRQQEAAAVKYSLADNEESAVLPRKVKFDADMEVADLFTKYAKYLDELSKVPSEDGTPRKTPPSLKESLSDELDAIADLTNIKAAQLGEEDIEAVLYAGLAGGSFTRNAQSTPEDDNEADNDESDPLLKAHEEKQGDKSTKVGSHEDEELKEINWLSRISKPLKDYQKLKTDKDTFKNSVNAVRFAVFCDTVNGMILQPNYAIMCTPGAHPDSFPNTNPFGFSSATYFVPMTALLGMAIAGAVTGTVSDKVGRKPVLLFCLAASMIGSIVKYLLRGTFWGFCAANFVNGLLSGSLPVALAYIGDVFTSNSTKAKQFSIVVGCNVLGQSTGGIIAILMFEQGLFAPLWVGSAIMFVATVVTTIYMVEPKKMTDTVRKYGTDAGDHDDEEDAPSELDEGTLANICIGALADTIGSKALFPLCLAPLAYDTFYENFVAAGETPIMSLSAYQWLSVLVAIMVIPSTLFTPKVFQVIGLAAGCVAGNAITGVLTIVLLLVANIEPPSTGSFAGFVIAMYAGYPFTVMSQLSTSPMLDRITPVDRRGNIQGLYTTVFNTGNAVAPWLLGLLADSLGTNKAIWIGIAVSFLAALINVPLMFKKQYRPEPKDDSMFRGVTPIGILDEVDLAARAARGENIPSDKLYAINVGRLQRHVPQLVPMMGTYRQDKDNGIEKIVEAARHELSFQRDMSHELLSRAKGDPALPDMLRDFNDSIALRDSLERHNAIGKWFADYIADSGYFMIGSPQVIKIMIMEAFPLLTHEDKLDEENFEVAMLKLHSLFNKYSRHEKRRTNKLTAMKLLKWPVRRFHG